MKYWFIVRLTDNHRLFKVYVVLILHLFKKCFIFVFISGDIFCVNLFRSATTCYHYTNVWKLTNSDCWSKSPNLPNYMLIAINIGMHYALYLFAWKTPNQRLVKRYYLAVFIVIVLPWNFEGIFLRLNHSHTFFPFWIFKLTEILSIWSNVYYCSWSLLCYLSCNW